MMIVTRLVWLDSARTLVVVVAARLAQCAVEVVARLAQCARNGRCSWRLVTVMILVPHPKYYLLKWLPH